MQGLTGVLLPVVCLIFCGRDVADGLEQAAIVEPVDPFERGQFDSLAGLPGRVVDDLGLVQDAWMPTKRTLVWRSLDRRGDA